jgi:integrase
MKILMRDGSGTRDYRYLCEFTDRRTCATRLYFRRKGQPKIRMRELPGSPEFDAEYRRAFDGSVAAVAAPICGPAAPGSLAWLCQAFYVSAAFLALDEGTRRVRRRIFESICIRAGTFRYSTMRPEYVAKLRDEKAATPGAANHRIAALRALFKWATSPEYRHATYNPAKEVGYLKPINPDGHRIWTADEVAQYEKRHPIGTKARLALDLFLYTGARISDVARLGPQMERWFNETGPDGQTFRVQKLVWTEFKGRKKKAKLHELPVLPPLRASIDATRTGHLVYLATIYGKPYSVKGLGIWFVRQCRRAGLDAGLTAHGIRKHDAVRAVEEGATEHQVMALFGWTSTKQVELYTRKANRSKLEMNAAPLLLKGQTANKSVPLFSTVDSHGTIRAKK